MDMTLNEARNDRATGGVDDVDRPVARRRFSAFQLDFAELPNARALDQEVTLPDRSGTVTPHQRSTANEERHWPTTLRGGHRLL